MHKLVRGAFASAIVIATLSATPSAFAANHDNNCESIESCVFLDSNYGGGMDDMSVNDASFLNNHFSSGASVHDNISSGFPVDRAVRYWVDVNYGGASFILGANQYDPLWTTNQPNASSSSYNFNDKVDSCAVFIP